MNSERFEMSEDFFLTVRECLLATSKREGDFGGIPVYVNKHMPKDFAILLDSNGNIVKIFKMEH